LHFSTETHFEFAFDIVQDFKLQLNSFPALQTIKQSRHPIVDMAFTDPATDSKHVPVHVMEDLISGDQRLLTKLFYALIRAGKPQNASGLFIRHNFATWAAKHVKDAYKSLHPYNPQ
jgi:hypothetical protein